jgi:hypothetical protein
MPKKKKLTKTQVLKLMKDINLKLFRMFEDRFEYGTLSKVPISASKILKDYTEPLGRAFSRVK